MPGKPIDPRTHEKIAFVRAALVSDPRLSGLALRTRVKARFGTSLSARIVAALKSAADAGPAALAAWSYVGGASLPTPSDRKRPRTTQRQEGRRSSDRAGAGLLDAALSHAGALVLHLSPTGVVTYPVGGPVDARRIIEKLLASGVPADRVRYFVARTVNPR
jgi:hypothetical protein